MSITLRSDELRDERVTVLNSLDPTWAPGNPDSLGMVVFFLRCKLPAPPRPTASFSCRRISCWCWARIAFSLCREALASSSRCVEVVSVFPAPPLPVSDCWKVIGQYLYKMGCLLSTPLPPLTLPAPVFISRPDGDVTLSSSRVSTEGRNL